MELDSLTEAYMDRTELISELKAMGKRYDFDKYSDKQLYRIWERACSEPTPEKSKIVPTKPEITHDKCAACGSTLTDGGFCPVCDDGAEDYEESLKSRKPRSKKSSKIKEALYICDNCHLEIELPEEEFDGCCPRCHDHTGSFGPCEESLNEAIPSNWVNYKGAWIYPVNTGFEANLDGLHYIADTEEELKAILDDAIKNGFTKDKKLAQYLDKPSRISHRAIWEDLDLFENWADDRIEELLSKPRNTWTEDDWMDYQYCLNANAERDYYDALDESAGTSISTQHAVISVVDQVKAIYEAGFFSKLPVGRENAFTIDIYGPDKERLVGYFKKQPEFNYELNNDAGIISHEFISTKYDIEIFDEFISMYKIPQNESLQEAPFFDGNTSNWVTASGAPVINNNQSNIQSNAPAVQQSISSQNTLSPAGISYVLSGTSTADENGDFNIIEVDGKWYGEVGSPVGSLRPSSYFSTLPDAEACAEDIILDLQLPWLDMFIYKYDSSDSSVVLVETVKASQVLGANNQNKTTTTSPNTTTPPATNGYLVEIVWDQSAHKYRARADDGVHGPANVAFPNNLRTPGAKYDVETLTWNGKNYRASGRIIPV